MAVATIERHPGFIKRQEQYKSLLPYIYGNLSTDEEIQTSAAKIAEKVGISTNQMDAYARSLEDAGILTRRLEFKQGRHYYWRLLMPLDRAVPVYDRYLQNERNSKPESDSAIKISGKTLIMTALNEHGTFSTVRDLVKYIGKSAQGKKGFHSITHELYSLEQEGKVAFKRRTSRSKAPYDIRLATKPMNVEEVKAIQDAAPSPEEIGEVEIIATVNPPEDIPEEQPTPIRQHFISVANKYPLIDASAHRRDVLEAAARLAEQGGEADLALALYEKATQPGTDYEEEAIRLYAAYLNCINA